MPGKDFWTSRSSRFIIKHLIGTWRNGDEYFFYWKRRSECIPDNGVAFSRCLGCCSAVIPIRRERRGSPRYRQCNGGSHDDRANVHVARGNEHAKKPHRAGAEHGRRIAGIPVCGHPRRRFGRNPSGGRLTGPFAAMTKIVISMFFPESVHSVHPVTLPPAHGVPRTRAGIGNP